MQITRAKYDTIDAVNWSTLKNLATSPMEYRYRLGAPKPRTSALAVGAAFHALVLEPDTFRDQFAVYPGATRRGKAWDAFQEENAGKEILLASEHEKCIAMAKAARGNKHARELLTGGVAETSRVWTDPDSGIECKLRIDYLGPAGHVSLKSSRYIVPDEFGKDYAQRLYHAQDAFYTDGVALADETDPPPTHVITVQNEAPFDVAVYHVPSIVIGAGRLIYKDLLGQLAECRRTKSFPGVAPHVRELPFPEWAMPDTDLVF